MIECINSSAGSGKTYTLVNKIIKLVDEGFDPEKIIAFTFTKYAANEMKERLCKIKGLTIGTMHSIFLRALNVADKNKYVNKNTILSDMQKLIVMQKILTETKYGFFLKKQEINVEDVSAFIGLMKNFGYEPEAFPVVSGKYQFTVSYIPATPRFLNATKIFNLLNLSASSVNVAILMNVYKKYIETLEHEGKIDFDDMLFLTAKRVDENVNGCLDYLQNTWNYVLVDEFQDSNSLQINLLRRMTEKHNNLFLIGDWKQSIYEWRGSDYKAIQNISDYFQDVKFGNLTKTYRNSKEVLRIANKVATHLGDCEIETVKDDYGMVEVKSFVSEKKEAEFVINRIRDIYENSEKTAFILARTNYKLLSPELSLIKYHIPYSISGQSIFKLPLVNAFLKIFWLVITEKCNDYNTFEAVFQVANKYIRKESKEQFKSGGLESVSNKNDQGVMRNAIEKVTWLQERYRNKKENCGQCFENIYSVFSFDDYIKNSFSKIEGATIKGIFEELILIAHDYDKPEELVSLIAKACESDKHADERIKLLTIHSAKGLEADNVFLIGMVNGIFPSSKSSENMDQMLAEKRLFYVGVTRAIENLCISYYGEKSEFLNLI